MSLARLVVTAIKVEGRSKSEVARSLGVSRYWVQQLVKRYDEEGEAGLLPRSRRPRRSPNAVPVEVENEIVRLRKQLSDQGLDAGAQTIAAHLCRTHRSVPATSTIWRVLTRRGFVTPQPQKRPKSSYLRFEADQPNERWQADVTHWQLVDGTDVEMLNIVDDHSRLCVASDARRITLAADVVTSFADAFARHGLPASVLTDNGAIFTANSRGAGRTALEVELGQLGGRATPTQAYTARPKATRTASSSTHTSEFAPTASTPPAVSPSATTPGCTTSDSDDTSPTPASQCSSPTSTSASSTATPAT